MQPLADLPKYLHWVMALLAFLSTSSVRVDPWLVDVGEEVGIVEDKAGVLVAALSSLTFGVAEVTIGGEASDVLA